MYYWRGIVYLVVEFEEKMLADVSPLLRGGGVGVGGGLPLALSEAKADISSSLPLFSRSFSPRKSLIHL